jgi:hypothetical protein
MACSVTINSVTGVADPQTGGSVITVTGTCGECDTVQVTIRCGPNVYTAVVPHVNQAWTLTQTTQCACGEDVRVAAQCASPNNPACVASPFIGALDCGSKCCMTPDVQVTIDPECTSAGQRAVSLLITGSALAGCTPYSLDLAWGDSTNAQSLWIAGPGPYSFTRSHAYSGAAAQTFQAVITDNAHPDCPPVTIDVPIQPCVTDCCPKGVNAEVSFGDCGADCRRQVSITTHFQAFTPPCWPATLEWSFFDKDNQPITNVNPTAFSTGGPSPRTESFWFDPAASPITGRLVSIVPESCGVVAETTFEVPACDSPPACPEITGFSHSIDGCAKHGERCCRMVELTVDADVLVGCGQAASKPKFKVDFGDGSYGAIQFNDSGSRSGMLAHAYCEPGTYVATLSVENPPWCPETRAITFEVPKCDPSECGPPPPPPPKCPCCIWWFLAFSAYFVTAALGWHTASFQVPILNVQMGVYALAAAIFLFLLLLIIAFCYQRNELCRKCLPCRLAKCTFWSCLIIAIVLIIIQVIGLIYGTAIFPWSAFYQTLLALFVAGLAGWIVRQTAKCVTFFKTGECD